MSSEFEECTFVENPSYVTPVSVVLIVLLIISLVGEKVYMKFALHDPYRSYPRLRVRPMYSSYAYYLILFLAGLLCLLDVIGYDKIPCSTGYIIFGIYAQSCLLQASAILVYSFRVKLSQLKRERNFAVYKRLKMMYLGRFKWIWRFLFVGVPLITNISFAILERDVIFHQDCYGCDYVIPGAEYVPKVHFFIFTGYMCLVLIPLFSIRHYPDVFAHFPEFRLGYLLSTLPCGFLGYFMIGYDKEFFGGLHSRKIFRGHWLLSIGLLISFYISRVYQIYLASIEGQLINPNGVDFLSNFWNLLKRRWSKNQTRIDMFELDEDPSLEEFLSTSSGYQLFEEYSLSEYCVELTRFHKVVKDFEDHYDELSHDIRSKEAKEIYRLYIARSAPLEINISGALRTKYASIFSKEDFVLDDRFVFKNVDKEILTLLEHGPYLRFKHTSTFRETRKSNLRKSKKTIESMSISIPVSSIHDS